MFFLSVREGARLAGLEYKQRNCPDWLYGENENKTTPEQDSLFDSVAMDHLHLHFLTLFTGTAF